MDEDLVYTMTKTLQESVQELAERQPAVAEMARGSFTCGNLSIPLHPGAQRYYQEIGLITAGDE